MASKKSRKMVPRILSRILIGFSGFLVLVLIVLVLTIAFLPKIVSTDKAREFISEQIETSLNHSVRIQDIEWTWTNGIKISGINVPELKNSSDNALINIPRAHLMIQFLDLFKRRLNFSFLLESPSIRLVRDKTGQLNLVEVFAGSEGPEQPSAPGKGQEPDPETEERPFKLPLDVRTEIHLADISITYQDHQAKRYYRLQNGNIHLRAPDLANQPVTAAIDADISLNGREIQHAAINANVRNLFDPSRQLRPDRMAAQVDAELPGAAIQLKGDMADTGIKADASVDLKALADAAAPLLPELLNGSDVGGQIALNAEAVQAAPDTIGFDAALTGKALSLAGSMLAGKRLGPGDISVAAAGQMDLKKFDLKLNQSEISFLDNSYLACRGNIQDLRSPAPTMDLKAAPVYVDIQEIAAFVKSYLPPALVLGQSVNDQQDLSIEKIHLRGRLPVGQASVNIQALNLTASDIGYQTDIFSAKNISIKDAGISLQSVKAELDDLMPLSAELQAAFEIGHMAYETDETQMSMNGFSLDNLIAKANQIRIEKNSPLGISGNFKLSNTAGMRSFKLTDLLALTGLGQELDLNIALTPDGKAAGAINRLGIQIPGLNLKTGGYWLPETSAGLDLAVTDLRLIDMDAGDVDIKGLDLAMEAGRMIRLSIAADAEQSGKKHLNAELASEIDFTQIMKALGLNENFHMDAAGDAKLDVRIAGRRPDPKELEGLKAFKMKKNLGFLEHLGIHLTLADGAVDYKMDETSRLLIDEISGDPLLAYTLSGKNATGQLSSQTRIDQVLNLMGIQPEAPMSGQFSLDVTHNGLERISGAQRLQIQPGNADQSIEIDLDGLRHAITANSPYEIFQQISGQAAASIKLQESQALKKMTLPGLNVMDLNGALSGFIKVQKLPMDTVAADLRLNIRDFSAEMPDSFALNGINGSMMFTKAVTIKPSASMTDGAAAEVWLSQQMMQDIEAYSGSNPSAAGAFRGTISPDKEYKAFEQGLTLGSGKISAGNLPIAIGPSRIDIGLSQGLPAIESLKLDILGGTLLGDLSIKPQSDGYALETRINFTGLDPASIFPNSAVGIKSEASEISGAIYANLPVARKMKNLLENSEIVIEFRKIGRRALERLLYALDPYESNEAIVSQRRLLRMGSPRQIQISIKNGFLSLEGKVLVKSVPISIPPLQRLNIAQLPGIQAYASSLAVMEPIIHILDMASADTLGADEIFGK